MVAVTMGSFTRVVIAADRYGPTAASETLWSVAKKVTPRGQGVSIAQAAWAIYETNPQAFDRSPNALRTGSMLLVPGADAMRRIDAREAYARITGAPTLARPPVPAESPAPAATGPAPYIHGVELRRQAFAVGGWNFQPGAKLQFRNLARGTPGPLRTPRSVKPNRIEYTAQFPARAVRWQVVVINPDGERSEPYEFEAASNLTLVMLPLPEVPPPEALVVRAPPVAMPVAPVLATEAGAGAVFAGSTHEQAARAMLEKGERADSVYRYLAPLDGSYAGDLDYDYALGTAAFDSGRFSEAIFVLQRAVATRPKFAGARMELARAYYAAGDNESARREFVALEKEQPPPEARRVIGEYLDAIDRRAVTYEPQRGFWAELASGYDSNANGAPDTQNFLGFALDSRNQSTSSSYYTLAAGADASHPLAPGWRLLGTGVVNYRSNPDAPFVDSQVARIGAGIEMKRGAFTAGLVPGYTHALLDGDENHTNVGADLSASYDLAPGTVSASARYSQQRYVEALAIQDVDQAIFGVSTQVALPTYPRLMLVAALTAGAEDAVDPFSPFSRDLTGARGAVLADFGRGHAVIAGFASLESEFDEPFFGLARTDEQFGGSLGYEYANFQAFGLRGWSARIQVNYVDNVSTVELYDYERVDAGFGLRKEFR